MDRKVMIIGAVVVVIALVAASAAVVLNNDKGEEKKGLYALDATILEVDMGGMSGTPKMVETIEYMYKTVYGDLKEGADKLTLADAKADTTFWNTYCNYESTVSVDSTTGAITYKTVVDDSGKLKSVIIDGPADVLIATGTAFPTVVYYVLCEKYNVTPYSTEALNNTDLVKEFQAVNYGSLDLDSVKTSSEELAKYYSSNYVQHCTSIKSYDKEQLAQDITDASAGGKKVILMGSGTLDKENNAAVIKSVTGQGGYVYLNTSASMLQTFAGIEQVATLLGYADEVQDVIEEFQLKLYKIYWSAQDHTAEKHKAYFEGSSGKASKSSGSGFAICSFLNWDTSLFTGAEIDTETLLKEKPDVIIFYTNDDRSMDVKMRATS